MIGNSIRLIVPEELQHEEDDILARIRRGETVASFQTTRIRKSGIRLIVSVSVSPVRDISGRVVGASKIARDVTAEVTARRMLEESEERFRTLADNMHQFAWMADSKGWIFWYNQRWFDYTGTTLEQMQGWGWQGVHHPDYVDGVRERIQRSWDTGEPWEDTFPLLGTNGEYRWFLSRAVPIRDEAGNIVRWFGTNTDITEQREREEHNRFLMREVNHRAKNLLALVQAIARETAGPERNSPFVARLSERLVSLGASVDLLVNSGWRGAEIRELITSLLAHFKDLIGSRIHLNGPSLRLSSAGAQMLGMAVHELATNAGKNGALSNHRGEVAINWDSDAPGDGATRFWISWTETGGPPVKPPKRSGFGTSVVGRMAKTAFAGAVQLECRPEGLFWRLENRDGRGIE